MEATDCFFRRLRLPRPSERLHVPGATGIYTQPDNAFIGRAFLQFLHFVTVVKLVDEGTGRIGPFQDNCLPLVLRQGVFLAVCPLKRELGCWLSQDRAFRVSDRWQDG